MDILFTELVNLLKEAGLSCDEARTEANKLIPEVDNGVSVRAVVSEYLADKYFN